MRHIGTVIAAAIVGPLAWILLALGQDRTTRLFENAQEGSAVGASDFLRPLLVLAAAGILLGLIATLRFSPLGAVLTGIGYAASYVGLLVSPMRLMHLLNHHLSVAGHQVDLASPARTGTSLLLGSLLLVGIVSVQRWRRWPRADDEMLEGDFAAERSPAVLNKDRPLGVDGLGLNRSGVTSEPEPVTPKPEPEPVPAMAGSSEWVGSLRDGPADSTWHSDRAR